MSKKKSNNKRHKDLKSKNAEPKNSKPKNASEQNKQNNQSKQRATSRDTYKKEKQKTLVGEFPRRVTKRQKTNELTLVRVAIVMVIAIALTTWLKTDKLAGYWLQEYDTNQPFARMGDTSIGKAGQGIETFVNDNKIEDGLSAISKGLNSGANQLFYAQEVAKRDKLIKQKAMAHQKAQRSKRRSKAKYLAKISSSKRQQYHTQVKQTQRQSINGSAVAKIEIADGQKALFIGDSLMQGVAPWVMRQLQRKHQIDSIDLSKHSTGLAYSKFFDWPATVEKTLPENPEVVALFVFLGGNDGQSVVDPNTKRHTRFASERWDELYSEKIQRIIQTAEQYNVQILWVTPPHMKDKKLSKQTAHLTELFEKNIPQERGIIIHSKELLQTDTNSNKYSDRMMLNGKKTKVRTADGVHFTTKGQKYLANAIMERVNVNGKPMLESDKQ